ncbi:MAG: type IV secretion system DNA-binding domain-containing protein [Ktedonobacteraceae bacterium]|nr:type IV secretion system DNA-binding domain-containing protein [Ktedonobacteraceae bacterium]
MSSQQNLPRYLRAATLVLLDNPGATLLDMYNLLTDEDIRQCLVANASDSTVKTFWRAQYDALSEAERSRRVQPLINRLESLFMGRSIIRNIVGQPNSTISFRRAIERREAVFIKLPVKLVQQDAALIGTIIIAQLSAAVFSFADIPESTRPGVSLYVDEFQHFSTPDFASLFTEGRKFGMRVVVAHQFRDQLPAYLQQSTMTARTKVCFRPTPEDAKEMAALFPITSSKVAPEDLDIKAAETITYRFADFPPEVQVFVKTYLQPLNGFKRGRVVEIRNGGLDIYGGAVNLLGAFAGGSASNAPIEVPDPLPYLNSLCYESMSKGSANLAIQPEVVRGLANGGRGFFAAVRHIWHSPDLLATIQYPDSLVVNAPSGAQWVRQPDGPKEQFYHCVYHLRATLAYLAKNPLGKQQTTTKNDVAQMLSQLPKRSAFVRSGEAMATLYTIKTGFKLTDTTLDDYLTVIRDQTRTKYCHPVDEVEHTFEVVDRLPPSPLAAVIDGVLASRWEEVDEL